MTLWLLEIIGVSAKPAETIVTDETNLQQKRPLLVVLSINIWGFVAALVDLRVLVQSSMGIDPYGGM
jgi:hypothetical protein